MLNRAAKNITEMAGTVSVLLLSVPCAGQFGTPAFTDSFSNPLGVSSQKLTYIGKDGAPTDRGKSFSETIRGNGTRAGYSISHGGVIPESVSLSVGARRLHPNVDYYLDPTSGAIGFAEPIRRLETISVSYRYVEGQDASRSPISGLSGLSLNMSGSTLNFGLGISTSASGIDFTTYGLRMNSKAGSKVSSDGLFYFSTPNASKNNLVGNTREAFTASAKKAQSADAVSDHLIAQNLSMKSGAITLRGTFQDIGQHFNGFQAMKQANAKDADALKQIGMLEKETGVKRLGFGAGMLTGKVDKAGKYEGNVGFDWDSISDGKGSISHHSLGYQSNKFNLKYSEQEVGKTFERFTNLREADAAQWAKEKGVKHQELSLGMTTGKDTLLGFSQNTIGDTSGAVKRDLISFGNKTFQFGMSSRKTGEKFARMADLSDADKTNLALDIRRQFNPNAEAKEVTAADKAQLVADTGLTRDRLALGGLLGKKNTFAFNQFTIGDKTGKIERQTFNFATKGATFNYMDQTISEGFTRLTSMSDFEKLQFGNEHGIRRQMFGVNLTPNKLSTFTFSALNINSSKAGLSKESFAYTSKGVDVKYNLASVEKTFDRIGDLASFTPEEKAAMEAERGYKRTDYTANITAIKGLTLNSYNYDAHNAVDKLDKNVFKHSFAWTGSKLTQISFLTEGNMIDKDGKAENGTTHELMTFNQQLKGGMKLNFLRDTLNTVAAGVAAPSTATEFMHFETDKKKANNLVAETKRVDFTNGKFENTVLLDLNYKASNAMSFHFNKLGIDRGTDPSSDTSLMDWKWQMSKKFSFTGTYATTTANNQTTTTTKAMAMTGPLDKNLNFTGTYTEVNQPKVNVKAVSDVAISNAKPMKILALKNVTFTGRFASVNDQKKQQSQNVSGKIQGMIAKHQIGMEYGSILNPDGTNAISRIISFVTDPDPKLPFHLNMLYKARTVNRNNVNLVRKYKADYRVDKATSVTYDYVSLPEDAAGAMQPTKTSAFVFKHAIDKTLNFGVDYTTSKQMAAMTETSKLGGLLNGKVDKQTALEVGYSVDLSTLGAQHTDSHTVKVGFDHQVDGDHYITLSTSFKENKGSPDEMLANIDFKTRF